MDSITGNKSGQLISVPLITPAKRRRVRLITEDDSSDEESRPSPQRHASSTSEISQNPEAAGRSESSEGDRGPTTQREHQVMQVFSSPVVQVRSQGAGEISRGSDRNSFPPFANARRQSGSRMKSQRQFGPKSSNQSKRTGKSVSTISSGKLPNSQTSLGTEPTNDHAPDSDDFCWICHKVGQMVVCTYCPRVYHPACLHMTQFPETWLCPECQDLVIAECLVYQAPNWKQVTKGQLQRMLYFLLDRLAMQSWAEHFREPVDTTELVDYLDIVFFPMNLRSLYLRNKEGRYSSPQAFLGDFRWILHNCIVFNGSSAPITSHARLLDRTCVRELALMKACPTCYQNRMSALHLLPATSHKLPPITEKEWMHPTELESTGQHQSAPASLADTELDPWWFCELCDDIHPLVWVRLQHYPRWPAKVLCADGDNMLVTFFGDYDLTMAPTASVKLHSEAQVGKPSVPRGTTSSGTSDSKADGGPASAALPEPVPSGSPKPGLPAPKSVTNVNPRMDASYHKAVAELNHHVALIKARYPTFKLPATSVPYTKRFVNRYYERFRKVTTVPRTPSATTTTIATVATVPECVSLGPELSSEPQQQPHSPTSSTAQGDSTTMASHDVVPLLSRVASTLKQSFNVSTTNQTSIGSNTTTSTSVSCRPRSLLASSSVAAPRAEKLNSSEPATTSVCPSVQPMETECFRSPIELHPLPVSPGDPTGETDEVRSLLDKFRFQFNEALADLESKWRSTKTVFNPISDVSHEPPTLCAAMVDKDVQTLPIDDHHTSLNPEKSSPLHHEASLQRLDDDSSHQVSNRPVTAFQSAMMEAEIERLDQEVKRLNLLLAFTRAEQALESRNRILELRRVWNFEVSAILEAASKIWEQDVIQIVDAVKRKQWCAYCGRVAYYYCCWNTCYCNSICQSKHWGLHINQCVQARSQNTGSSSESAESHVRVQKQLSMIPGQLNLSVPQSNQQSR